jgi:phage terminase large subunit-like protein
VTSPRFKLTDKQAEAQSVLAGPQRHTLLVGGARSGKTFLLTRSVVIRALKAPHSRHAILRFRGNSVWASIGLDTLPKVMRLCFPGVGLAAKTQDKYFVLPNGSEIWLGGLDDKERVEKILGQEYATIYFNEASQIPYSSYLVAQTRLAQVCDGLKQREYVDLNPSGTGHWTYRQFIQQIDPDSRRPLADKDNYRALFLNPRDNAGNLSPEFLKSLENLPERHRKRFFEGQYVAEIDGALWTFELIDKAKVEPGDVPAMRRVVVAVDPSGASGKGDSRNDSIGIVVAGVGYDGNGYILADRTCDLSPAGWGRVAVTAYHEFGADRIIAEDNFGGAMVEHVIKTTDHLVPYAPVKASRGKAVRAEPVSALYEKGRVFHAGRFPDLEDQMSNFSTAGYMGDKSPDRADALVWALTELMLTTGPSVMDVL